MRSLPKPPDWSAQIAGTLLPKLNQPEVQDFVRGINLGYHHWDTVRYRPRPQDLSAADAWWAVKLSRSANQRLSPLADAKGRPFTFWVPDQAAKVLHDVDFNGGGSLATWTQDQSLFEQTRQRILIESRMEEGISTSQIEGAVTTIEQGKELLRSGDTPKNENERMVVNGYRTMQMLIKEQKRPLDREFLFEIQRSMTDGTLQDASHSGRFRCENDKPVVIVDERDEEIIFQPPSAKDVETRMDALIAFANQAVDSTPFIHPIVRAAMLHFGLAYEHPFMDGNGRTARALFYWFMLKNGYWLFEFLTISRVINASRMAYYKSFLYSEHDDNDLTYFITHQLEVTAKAIEQLRDRISVIARNEIELSHIRSLRGLNVRQRAVIQHALKHPSHIYTIESHQNAQGVTYQTARTDLMGLRDRKFLLDLGTKKPLRFAPARDLSKRVNAEISSER